MFTTACFIRVNNPELRSKLEDLGYTNSELFNINNSCLATSTFTDNGNYNCIPELCVEDINPHSSWKYARIDCGENISLFLAIAALRDDSDYMQWFVDDYDNWQLCYEDDYMDYTECNLTNYHKANVEELINHFK